MKRIKGNFKLNKRKVVFSKGPIHLLDCEVKMPSGNVLSRQVIEHPGAVVIVPRIKKGRYLLIKQFRFATGRWIWEFPAGGIEPGETLRQTAKRECIEEVGYRPKKLTRLLDFYPTPGISSEVMYLYLAEDLTTAYAEGDEDEAIEVHEFSEKQIQTMIRKGEIVDGKTILAFLILKHPLQKR